VPPFAQLADIHLLAVFLHTLEKKEAGEDEKQRYCTPGYHRIDEYSEVVIYTHACQSAGMKLFNVNLGSQSMDEHYEHGKGKPQQIDAF